MKRENWFITGDLHGDVKTIREFYKKNKKRLALNESKNHLILLGDAGLNYFMDHRDEKFKKVLSSYPFSFVCLRGNHEARVSDVMAKYPSQWEKIPKYGWWVYVEKAFPNIEYLDDGPAIYEFAGYKTLSLPGAYSIDKWYRLSHGLEWFIGEQLSEEEMEFGKKLTNQNEEVDLVISHTCPLHLEPRDLFLPWIDQTFVDKKMELYLEEIEKSLSYKRWVFGHFHDDRLYPADNEKRQLLLMNQVIDLRKFMHMRETDSSADILA